MAFNYDPKAARDTLPDGSYDAEIVSVEEKRSVKGNDMLVVTYRIPWDGKDWKVVDYIVNPSTLFKLKKIAAAFHQSKEFEDRRFDLTEFVGRPISLTLETELGTGSYPDKNVARGYGESNGIPQPIAAPPGNDELVPF